MRKKRNVNICILRTSEILLIHPTSCTYSTRPVCTRIELYVKLETVIYLSYYLSTMLWKHKISKKKNAVSAVKGITLPNLFPPAHLSAVFARYKWKQACQWGASCSEAVCVQRRPSLQSPLQLPHSMLTTNLLYFWVPLPKEQQAFRKRNWPLAAKCTVPPSWRHIQQPAPWCGAATHVQQRIEMAEPAASADWRQSPRFEVRGKAGEAACGVKS